MDNEVDSIMADLERQEHSELAEAVGGMWYEGQRIWLTQYRTAATITGFTCTERRDGGYIMLFDAYPHSCIVASDGQVRTGITFGNILVEPYSGQDEASGDDSSDSNEEEEEEPETRARCPHCGYVYEDDPHGWNATQRAVYTEYGPVDYVNNYGDWSMEVHDSDCDDIDQLEVECPNCNGIFSEFLVG